MAVIQLPERDNGMMERFLMNWMNQRQDKRQHSDTLAQQESQFGRSHELDTQRTGATVNLANTQADAASEAQKRANAILKLENFQKQVGEPLQQNGKRVELEQAFQRFLSENPDAKEYVGTLSTLGQNLDTDVAAQNTAKYSADQTGIAASGSQDAQARAFTQESALGRGMSAHQFGDQVQRQGSPDAYNQYVEREGGARPNAGQQLAANTQLTMNREDNAAMDRRLTAAGGAGGASDGLSAGTKTKLAAVDAGLAMIDKVEQALNTYNEMDMTRDPKGKLMAGLQLKALVQGGAPLIARAMGEVGNLSKDEQAAARTLTNPGLFATTAWPELAAERIRVLRSVAERTKSGMMGGSTSMGGAGSVIRYDETGKRIQ